ncbi:TonB-dependent receptor plug domain-containing protein [Mucilaginibacter xinganensis]|nr:TonB-dependent receptor plug domain-containing protein [Mucilaginibacter xinganensis]
MPFTVFAQVKTTVNEKEGVAIENKLAAYLSSNVREQAYLHFDKPYYAAGDTIYFKAYVTMGERHELSQISGLLHVDLINTQDKIDQSLLLKLTGGVSWGDFALPDSLPKGQYRVRAYTTWMRNESEAAFFTQAVPVGSPLKDKVPESGTRPPMRASNKPEVQFFPEGGSLVTGIRSKIAFKAINENGKGINVKGTVTDNTGNVVAVFAAAHFGMGYFYLEPEAGKSYRASVQFADGSQNTIDLPGSEAQGISLTVNNDSVAKASVVITANKACYEQNKDKEYQLLIYSGGTATRVSCRLDSAVVRIDLAKRHLRTGVNTVTLFSPGNEPLCERLFFVQNYDQLSVAVTTDKEVYATREKVHIKLNVKNRADSVAAGHFSVAITDESKVPVDENNESTLLSNLLLTADLKGSVEQPNYYFNNITDEKLKQLDLVMLTNGYRRFEWRQVLNSSNPQLTYQPERKLEIAGVAQSLGGKSLANAAVSLISPSGGPVLSETTDSNGNFKFRNLEFLDKTTFVLQAVNAKGGNKTGLLYKPAAIPTPPAATEKDDTDVNRQISAYMENSRRELNEYNRYGTPKGIMLQEVKIKEIKAKDTYRSSVYGGPGHADQVVHMDDIRTGGDLVDKLNGILRSINIVRVPGATSALFLGQKMLIVVDGVAMDPRYDFNSLGPNDVETVEALKYANASIYGMGSAHGVLVFTTRIGHQRNVKDIPSFGILPITPPGYYKARMFYFPRYDIAQTNVKTDLRSTIYWNPALVTGKDGNTSFDCYNADGRGTYRVVIEGIDVKGNLGRTVYRYTVK